MKRATLCPPIKDVIFFFFEHSVLSLLFSGTVTGFVGVEEGSNRPTSNVCQKPVALSVRLYHRSVKGYIGRLLAETQVRRLPFQTQLMNRRMGCCGRETFTGPVSGPGVLTFHRKSRGEEMAYAWDKHFTRQMGEEGISWGGVKSRRGFSKHNQKIGKGASGS